MFLGNLYKPKQTCIVGYLCLLFVYILVRHIVIVGLNIFVGNIIP